MLNICNLQTLMTRLGHIEFNLHRTAEKDLSELRNSVGDTRRAERLEAADSIIADTLAFAPMHEMSCVGLYN